LKSGWDAGVLDEKNKKLDGGEPGTISVSEAERKTAVHLYQFWNRWPKGGVEKVWVARDIPHWPSKARR